MKSSVKEEKCKGSSQAPKQVQGMQCCQVCRAYGNRVKAWITWSQSTAGQEKGPDTTSWTSGMWGLREAVSYNWELIWAKPDFVSLGWDGEVVFREKMGCRGIMGTYRGWEEVGSGTSDWRVRILRNGGYRRGKMAQERILVLAPLIKVTTFMVEWHHLEDTALQCKRWKLSHRSIRQAFSVAKMHVCKLKSFCPGQW